MKGLTLKELECLRYISAILRESGGMGPSYSEIASAMGLASNAGVYRLITSLERKGCIRRLPHRARAIEVVDTAHGVGPWLASLSDQSFAGVLETVSEEIARRAAVSA